MPTVATSMMQVSDFVLMSGLQGTLLP
jgi:hypothetical protein